MFWVIMIIGGLLIMFLLDKKEEVSRVQSQGGFYLKYKELINHFATIPRIKVVNKSNTSITLSVKDSLVVTSFTISHGFEDVSIFWNHNSIAFGKHSLNWRFPESMPQYQMISLIEDELSIYERNIVGV